jgi:hypothetical protein
MAAVALLLLNDHVLKTAWPGSLTGKLSDFAGLAFFPLFLQAAWEIGCLAYRRPVTRSQRVLFAATVLTVVGFTLVKTLPLCAEGYRYGLSALRWPFGAFLEMAHGGPLHGIGRVSFVRDPSDLVALPAALIGLVVQSRATRPAEGR